MTSEPHPALPGYLADRVGDHPVSWPVRETRQVHADPYLSVRIDTIADPADPSGAAHHRTVVETHDAVAVVALDDADRVLLVEQYRHAVGGALFEIPAGLLDVDGEPPADAAARELAEEADVRADRWEPLLTMASNPGFATGSWTVYLATGLSAVPEAERVPREAEEARIMSWWLPFDDAVTAVLDGRITNALTVGALLALAVRRGR